MICGIDTVVNLSEEIKSIIRMINAKFGVFLLLVYLYKKKKRNFFSPKDRIATFKKLWIPQAHKLLWHKS